MASLKQATYVRERYPEAKIYVFYIDLRTPGLRYERFYEQIKKDENMLRAGFTEVLVTGILIK